MNHRLAIAFITLMFSACEATVDAADYDQTCTVAEDCTAVFSGDLCGECTCANAAIANSDHGRYSDDVSQVPCPPDIIGGDICLCGIPATECVEGTCRIVR